MPPEVLMSVRYFPFVLVSLSVTDVERWVHLFIFVHKVKVVPSQTACKRDQRHTY